MTTFSIFDFQFFFCLGGAVRGFLLARPSHARGSAQGRLAPPTDFVFHHVHEEERRDFLCCLHEEGFFFYLVYACLILYLYKYICIQFLLVV